MSRYRLVSVRMWGDAKFCELSAPEPNGQTLWFYLLTGEHTTAIPGVVRAGEAALAESLGWPVPAFRKAFSEIYSKGMARPDWSRRLVFLPKALVHNRPQSPNVVIAWRKAFEELPDCPLKIEIGKCIKAYLEGFGEAYQKAFDVAFQETIVDTETETRTGSRTEDLNARKARSKPYFETWFKEQFKPAYPKARRVQDKTALGELRKHKPDPDLCAEILARLEHWKLSADWTKDAGQFIPGMGKFFSDGYWQRDPVEPFHLNGNGRSPAQTIRPAEDYLSRIS